MFRKFDAYKLYLGLQFFTGLFFSMIFVVTSLYEATVAGLTGTQLVLVGTTLELTVLLFEVPTGIVADATGRSPGGGFIEFNGGRSGKDRRRTQHRASPGLCGPILCAHTWAASS